MGSICLFYVIRLLSVWAHWQSALLARQAQMMSHKRQKNYGLHTIARAHNSVCKLEQCTYFFPKQTLPMRANASTTKTSFSHLIPFTNMLKKFLFTTRHLLKVVFYLLMKPAGIVIVIMISVPLVQLMQNQKIVIHQQNGWSGKK